MDNNNNSISSDINNNNPNIKFKLPPTLFEDDVILVENILRAMQSLGTKENPICVKYKIDKNETGYILKAVLPANELYEIGLDDLLFIRSISPARIEHIAIVNTETKNSELIVHVSDCKQQVMIASTVSFFSASRKRSRQSI